MLDEKWTYWEGPRFSSSLPIKWKIVEDTVDTVSGTLVPLEELAAVVRGRKDVVLLVDAVTSVGGPG